MRAPGPGVQARRLAGLLRPTQALEAVYANVVTADLAEWNQNPELLSWLASL